MDMKITPCNEIVLSLIMYPNETFGPCIKKMPMPKNENDKLKK